MSVIPVFNPQGFGSVTTALTTLSVGEMWALELFAKMTESVLHTHIREGLAYATIEYAQLMLVIAPRASMISQNILSLGQKLEALTKKPIQYAYLDAYQMFKLSLGELGNATVLPIQIYGVEKTRGLTGIQVVVPAESAMGFKL